MKKFLLILFFAGCATARAQDLIVTIKGDSLNCKITKVKTDYIHFTFRHDDEVRNTLLPAAQIQFYEKNFYDVPEVAADQIKSPVGDHQKVRFGIYGGWGFRIARINENVPYLLQDHVRKLKSGHQIGGDFHYFFSENLGLGARYSYFRSGNQVANATFVDRNGQSRSGTLKEDVTIQYFGPSLSVSYGSSARQPRFFTDFSLGYLSFQDKVSVLTDFRFTGGTLGTVLSLGLDVPVAEDLALTCMLTYKAGVITQATYRDNRGSQKVKFEKENHESLTRIDVSFGLRMGK